MISSLNQEHWDAKAIELGGSILQSWAWGEFLQSLGHKIHRYSADDFICLGAEMDLIAGKKYLYCPRGPLGNTETALVDLKKLESDAGLVFARIEPQQPIKLPKALKNVQPTHNWVLTTDKSEEELLAGMKSKVRYNISLASRKGVVVKEVGKDQLVDFFKLMMETAGRNNFRLHPQNYYIHMWEALAPKNIKLLLAYYEDKPIAGLLLTVFGGTATYLHGGSSQKNKEVMAPFLLHWEAIKLAKTLGCASYDFGGIAENDDSDHIWAGITRFKKSFGGLEVVYPGAFDLIFSPIWYNGYKNARILRGIFRK
jgi:lipid II:glycine glycyltransferase (peptidoglycan interpeptide bridge formation enzyme)